MSETQTHLLSGHTLTAGPVSLLHALLFMQQLDVQLILPKNPSKGILSGAIILPSIAVAILGTVLTTLGSGATVVAPSHGRKKNRAPS